MNQKNTLEQSQNDAVEPIDTAVLSEKYLVSAKKCYSSNTNGPSFLSRLFSKWRTVGTYDSVDQVADFLKSYNYDLINNKCAFIKSYGKTSRTLVFEHEPYWPSGHNSWEKYHNREIDRSYELVRIKPLLDFSLESFGKNK